MVVVRWMEGRRGAVARLCCSRAARLDAALALSSAPVLTLSLSLPLSASFTLIQEGEDKRTVLLFSYNGCKLVSTIQSALPVRVARDRVALRVFYLTSLSLSQHGLTRQFQI